MDLYGSLVANEGSGGGGGGTVDVPIKSISVNGSGVAPVNKNVNIDVPTRVSELDNDNNYIKESELSIKKSDEVSSDYEASYKLVVKSGTEEEKVIGDIINIPKNYELTNAVINTCDEVDIPVAGYKVGDKYLDLTLSTGNVGSSGDLEEIEGSSCCSVTTDIVNRNGNIYNISFTIKHNSTHTSDKEVVILTFNEPVNYISSSGALLEGNGTKRLKIGFSYFMNPTDTVGATLTISCDSNPTIERAVCLCGGAGDTLSEDTASNEYGTSGSNTLNEKHIYVLLSDFASTTDIPTKVSELDNDSKFVTEDELTAKGYASTSDIPTKTSQLTNNSSFVTESDLTAKDYADKTYVGEQIAQSEHLKREVVDVLPEPSVADEHTIYMIKDESVQGNDKYKEYMLIEGVVQCVGDTSVDLKDYAKTADIPTELPANGGNADTVNNHTVESNVPVDAKFTDTVYDDTEVKESINDVNKSLSVIGKCKNLLNPTLQTTTQNGVTCTNNGDGTYTLNGTASGDATFILCKVSTDSSPVKLVGCPPNGSYSTYRLNLSGYGSDIGSGNTYDSPINDTAMLLQVISGTVCNNLLFKPMITTDLNATFDDFVPYTGDGDTLTHDVAKLNESLEDYGLDNKFDGQWKVGYYTSTGEYMTDGHITTSNPISVIGGANISVKYPDADNMTIAYFNGSTFISRSINKYDDVAPTNSTLCYVTIQKQVNNIFISPSTADKLSVYVDNAIDEIKNDLSPKRIELQNVDERVTIQDNGSFIINGFAFVNLLVTFKETLQQWSNFVRLPRPKGSNVTVYCENSVKFTIYSQDNLPGDCGTYDEVSSGTEVRLLVNYEVA